MSILFAFLCFLKIINLLKIGLMPSILDAYVFNYVVEILEFCLQHSLLATYSLNLHRIDKDVARCDRNNSYFTVKENLETLRRIMCSYVWVNLGVGYVQGMCDLVAPLLVIFDDGLSLTFLLYFLSSPINNLL